jgi:beta-ribofuranosylaminobenzene 5'-phosphate synthase
MKGHRLRIRTPSRLHFGLLGWGPRAIRQFGGVGLMIDPPRVEVSAEPAPSWQVEGPLATRVRLLLDRVRERWEERGIRPEPCRIRIIGTPAEHSGLGVGTQLSLAVATLLSRLADLGTPTAQDLARLTGRGLRSGIGLHGFFAGGLVVDGGRKTEDGVPPLLNRLEFPEDWSILLVQPPGPRGLHGIDETHAFTKLPPIEERISDRLCRLVLLGLLPAVLERDLGAFGDALSNLQADVGSCFGPAQGGVYRTPQAIAIVDELKRNGFVGVGQSSWGPTLYAFSDRSPSEIAETGDLLRSRFQIDPESILVTRAANRGATFVDDP